MSEQMYYVQDSRSYVGNSPLWWALGGGGYTCDIDKAELHTYDEAMALFESRNTDIPWKKEDVQQAVKSLVDSQYLKKSDEDGFYSILEKRKKEKRDEAKKEHEEYLLKSYKDEELFAIMDYVSFDSIKNRTDFRNAFDEATMNPDFEFHEHYYPTAYNKDRDEVFDDLVKYDFIFKCADCEKYFTVTNKSDNYQDLCDGCGWEKWEKENP